MLAKTCAAILVAAIPLLGIPTEIVAQPVAAAIAQETLAQQVSKAIRDVPTSLSGDAYIQALVEAINRALGNHTNSEKSAAIAEIQPARFSNPADVASALSRVRLSLLSPGAAAAHGGPLNHFHHSVGGGAVKQSHVAAAHIAPIVPPGPAADNSEPPPPPPPPAPNPTPVAPAAPAYTVKYNAPSVIPLGVPTDFRLIIESAHAAGASDSSDAPGPIEGHQLPKIAQVKAVMTGPSGTVDIAPASAPCQTVANSDNPVWDWNITPKTTTPIELHVELWDVGSDCNAPAPVVHRIDNFAIKVMATWWQVLTTGAGKLNSFLTAFFALIAAGGAAFGAWKWLKPGGKAGA